MQLAGAVPTVTDRVIQQAIAQVLGPIFDPGFSDSSFGFRPGRSAHGAVRQVQGFIGEGFRTAADLDLAKFSATAPALLYLLHPCSRSTGSSTTS